MHSLSKSKDRTIPALYVKSAPRTYDIRSIFLQARAMAPCMLILEDIDTIVTASSRSYFFNEVDGLENNDGIFMVASTNHLDRLDPGLSSRPSRFDRKYLFPLPSQHERTLYCEYWRDKLKSKPSIKFPRKLSPAIAGITKDFSFAYLQEAFVATLLAIAGHRSEEGVRGGGDDEGGDLDDYELWREMKNQVKALRDDMGNRRSVLKTGGRIELSEDELLDEMEAEAQAEMAGQRSTLAIRSKKPMSRPHDIKDLQAAAVQNGPLLFDRDGNSTFPTSNMPLKDGAPKNMPLFARDGKLHGEGPVTGSSLT